MWTLQVHLPNSYTAQLTRLRNTRRREGVSRNANVSHRCLSENILCIYIVPDVYMRMALYMQTHPSGFGAILIFVIWPVNPQSY